MESSKQAIPDPWFKGFTIEAQPDNSISVEYARTQLKRALRYLRHGQVRCAVDAASRALDGLGDAMGEK